MRHCYIIAERQLYFCRKKNPLGAAARISSWLVLFVGPSCFSPFFGSARCVGGGPVEKKQARRMHDFLVTAEKYMYTVYCMNSIYWFDSLGWRGMNILGEMFVFYLLAFPDFRRIEWGHFQEMNAFVMSFPSLRPEENTWHYLRCCILISASIVHL